MRTGFKELDQLIGTLAPGSLNIIAARPAMGKTAFALTIAQHAALKEGVGWGSTPWRCPRPSSSSG